MKGPHSTQRRLRAALALGLLVAADGSSQADEGAWIDFEARIQYAFYTDDARSLGNLASLLATRQDTDPQRGYYEAFANYRLASLPDATEAARSGAAERCVATLEPALAKQPESVETLVLQSACLEALGRLKPLRAPLAAPKSRSHLARALRIAPANPRALLLDASGASTTEVERSLRRAISVFETEQQGVPRAPGWGAADAYLALGRLLLDRGELLPARDALERALLVAPEYAAARRLLARVTAG